MPLAIVSADPNNLTPGAVEPVLEVNVPLHQQVDGLRSHAQFMTKGDGTAQESPASWHLPHRRGGACKGAIF